MQSSANPGRSTSKYRISDWYFDAELHQLQRGEKQIRLEPRVAQLLTCLMTNPGSPVSREQLLETVWPATVVGDEALNNAVNKLRRAFEDDRHRPRFIETLPKIGYRLIAPVTTVADPGETHAESTPNPVTRSAANGSILLFAIVLGIALISSLSWVFLLPGRDINTGGLEEPGERSIAVLPFENLNHDPAQDYFADGMSDDLITELSRVPGLLVISRSSSYALRDKRDDIRDLARTLNANFIIEGSVRREAEKIRINAQLVDASSGHQIWAQRFDGSTSEVFALQDQITRQIVAALESKPRPVPTILSSVSGPNCRLFHNATLPASGLARYAVGAVTRIKPVFSSVATLPRRALQIPSAIAYRPGGGQVSPGGDSVLPVAATPTDFTGRNTTKACYTRSYRRYSHRVSPVPASPNERQPP